MTISLSVLLALAAALLAPFSSLAALLLLPAALAAIWREHVPTRDPLPWLLFGWLLWLPASLAWSQSPGLSLPQPA